jgi:hypothetical protein
LNVNIIGSNSFDLYYILGIVVKSKAQLERVEDILNQLRASSPPIDEADPFVCLLKFGGFLYFDSTYDIVAANSISFDEVQEGTSALYLGTHSDFPAMAVDPLFEAGRWHPCTDRRLQRLGYTKYAWVTPSEFLGDSIFTRSGGFAYLHVSRESIYVPVVPKTVGHKDNDLYVLDQPLKLKFDNNERLVPKNYDAVCVCARACVCVCARARVDGYVHMSVDLCACVYERLHVRAGTFLCVRRCTFTSCTRMHTHTLTHMHTHTHARMDACTQTHTHTRARGHTHTHSRCIFRSCWSGAQRQCAPQVCMWLYCIPFAPCWVY